MTILDRLVMSAHPTHFQIPSDRLFPQPHSKLFHPSDAPEDNGWVKDLAQRARRIAESVPSPLRLGHCDWRAEHVRFRGDDIVATYDWDSVAAVPEVRVVGTAAYAYTTDSSQQLARKVPTYEDILGFIDDYDSARSVPFTSDQREQERSIRGQAGAG